MHLDDTFRNKPSEKAELFNNYFYEQFSAPSNLISITLEIECINISLTLTLIKRVDSGPDGIHGKMFKKLFAKPCISSFTPFKVSYNTGSLSWQMTFQFTKKGARMILKTAGLFHSLKEF